MVPLDVYPPSFPPTGHFPVLIYHHHCISVSRMRTTVTLDDDVFEAARAQAQASGKSIGQVLSQLARRGLRISPPGVPASGLPAFKVPSDSEIIPSSRAKELLAEDAP
jgi:hypothetical protein